ncbi:helix-turn-helix domain-containing protein [Gloeobacter violaceus]|uniref:helix-turn-helix domain-containing protein n=1 Tax=Gloeobacter violaceus TaxID=33072 RepID=UPI0013E8AC53|nr:helix-turn-helix domain-containing protein [Gloeobacter violaceus]
MSPSCHPPSSIHVRQKAIALLAGGATMADVARQIGVAERTLQRWMKRPDFAAEVEHSRTTQTRAVAKVTAEDLGRQYAALLPLALSTIHELMTDARTKPEVRLRAAVQTLTLAGLALRQAVEPATAPSYVAVLPEEDDRDWSDPNKPKFMTKERRDAVMEAAFLDLG